MLSTIGKIFLAEQDTFFVPGNRMPHIFLNICKDGKMLGQMRFNEDPLYSKEYIRMAFNLKDTEIINPETTEGNELLEEIVIGGLIWVSMDNHYLIPKDVLPYMVVHDYPENNERMNLINARTRNILSNYGCKAVEEDMFLFDPHNGGKMLSDFLKRKQQQ